MDVEDKSVKKWTTKRVILELVGWIGATMLLSGYYLIQTRKVREDHKLYMFLNIAGAIFIMLNAWSHRAYPSTITNLLWALVGSVAVYKTLSK